MRSSAPDVAVPPDVRIARLTARLERERAARLEAEAVAERGLRDLYQRQGEIVLLGAVAAEANRGGSVESVMRFALEQICRHTGWPLGHVLLRARDPDGAPALASSGFWPADVAPRFAGFVEASAGLRFRGGVGLPGRILESGVPAWIADVTLDADFPRAPQARACDIRAAFGFPVLVGADVGAVLEFFADEPHDPDSRLLDLIAQVGLQLGRVLEREAARERLVHDAFHDALTGLPNRALFRERLELAAKRARRHPAYRFAVLFLDLDRFKVVNDSLGHLAGDRLIVELGGRLQRCLRHDDGRTPPSGDRRPGSDTLARLGGDEFTVLLDDIRDDSDAFRVAERLQRALQRPVVVDGHEIVMSASIGIATNAGPGGSADDMLRNADLAMYRAKAGGGARAELFDEATHAQALGRLQLESELRRALERDEFLLHFQPIVALDGGAMRGVEALVRWRHPQRGLVSPGDFIPVAEECGMIVPIGAWVLRAACGQMRAWRDEFPAAADMHVSVNISARQFAQPDLLDVVRGALRDSGLPASALKLEITESAAMTNAPRTQELLATLRDDGVRFSLDDFGTGYSSLSYLRRFPLQTLKIDRSFVMSMETEEESREIVRGIVALARTLGMEVVAEGTETAEQVARLRELRCEYAQGYFFQRPVEGAAIGERLAAGG